MQKNDKIYVAGHRGLVGSAILRKLQQEGFKNVAVRTHQELDLLDTAAVKAFFAREKPQYVFDAAAKVGGIYANNTCPADFIYENLVIQNNIIHSCYESGAKKLVFLGSACIYPTECLQPMKEEYLLGGRLEPTNQPYAMAKISGIVMCQSYNRQYATNFVSVIPPNAYGPNDNYDLQNSHVLPAFIRKFHEAQMQGRSSVPAWGTGKAKREFIHVDDIADGCLFVMNRDGEFYLFNLGSGEEISIKELAEMIKKISGFRGDIEWDASKPDGMMRRLMDSSRLQSMGWKPKIGLEEGIRSAYEWYAANFRSQQAR